MFKNPYDFYLILIDSTLEVLRNIYSPGGGGSGFGNLFQPDNLIISGLFPSGDYFQFPNESMDGSIASLGEKQNNGFLLTKILEFGIQYVESYLDCLIIFFLFHISQK